MSAYNLVFLEGVVAMGLKKALAILLIAGKAMDDSTVGQFIIHVNNGGVTKIVKMVEVK